MVLLAPMDNMISLALFLRQHRPLAGILIDSPSSPLILAASSYGVKLALLNAKLPRGQNPSLTRLIASKIDLILPATEADYTQLSLAGAKAERMPGWCCDLSSASLLGSGSWLLSQPDGKDLSLLAQGLGRTPSWMAAHTIKGEEALVAQVHLALLAAQGLQPGRGKLRTIVVPAEGRWDERWDMRDEFESRGLTVDTWTHPGGSCESLLPLPDPPMPY
jgi:3-deoxy-D-manno-octulosonic-acid transferase